MAKIEWMGPVPDRPTAKVEWLGPASIVSNRNQRPGITSQGLASERTKNDTELQLSKTIKPDPVSVSKCMSNPGLEHFGEQLRGSKFGHKMTREMYAYPNRKQHQRFRRQDFSDRDWETRAWKFQDDDHSEHSDAFLLVQRDSALVNFDLSMRHFASLDAAEFEAALEHVIAKGRTFKPVQSLQDWDGVPGAYVMVFDEYKQFYVGQSNDIRKRIKQHWGGRKSFDRVVQGNEYDSIFPVDELRALDTTRIYAARSNDPFAVEQRAEKAAEQRFCLNRMAGGAVSPLTLMLSLLTPRDRSQGIISAPLLWADYAREWERITNLIVQPKIPTRSSLAAELASLDMAIYSVERKDGSQFMWSRRETIRAAAVRGDLSVSEFAAFLEAMGETVIWPEG